MQRRNGEAMRIRYIPLERTDSVTRAAVTRLTCTEHVKRVMAKIKQRENDIASASKGDVTLTNMILLESVDRVNTAGEMTIERLARDLGVSNKVIRNVTNLLLRQGILGRRRSKRGGVILYGCST